MVITLGEASRQSGKSKSAILKAINSGRISASKGETGDWQIEPVELFRVYPPTSQPENGLTPKENPHAAAVELGILRERCSQLESQLSDTRQDRDHWRQQATALLTDQRPKPDPLPQPSPRPAEGRWGRAWSILRGKA